MKKLSLHGFNNITKSLSFNIYDICYTKTEHRKNYIQYINQSYNAERLTRILHEVTDIIGATVLNVARQDYEPQGSSVTMLIAEQSTPDQNTENREEPGPVPETVVAHLDKSHITVHTYPESHPYCGISSFRADIDVSTCGCISPLRALNFLIHSFESDIVVVDYRVRGFTRYEDGTKLFIDHEINSIQNFFSEDIRARYTMVDVNLYEENLFHTKMMPSQFHLDDYLFDYDKAPLNETERLEAERLLKHEISEIFYGRHFKDRMAPS
ncbi:MAG: adenosylmethionine decarboxylase [Gammaproteobacteria bacterium]|nr:adenosylmethionine decarboxylase [Gammaproteobacteria bacterium]